MSAISRRHVVAGAAWSVPVIALAQPAAAAACSPQEETYVPNLGVASTTGRNPANGHTVGDFIFRITNEGATSIPAGTVYTIRFETNKAPGTDSKNIVVSMVPSPSFATTPSGSVSLNPDGPPKGVRSFTATLVLAVTVAPGQVASQTWFIDSETGKGATSLLMTATLTAYSTVCGSTSPSGETTVGPIAWGAQAA